jgi:riboflavin kinase/FMN adenylyltransferase
MQIFRSSLEASGKLRGAAVAIGNFDGVHRGHQELFRLTRALALPDGHAVALTFWPHPARLLNPELAPPLITTEAQKLELLEACGLDAVVVEPFDRDFAALTAEEFVGRVLVERLGARHVVVGHGFMFGRDKAGTLRTLKLQGERLGFAAHSVSTVRVCSIAVTSTKIRELILLGRMGGASLLLGRDYLVEGTVVAGRGRGRTIGIPTANVGPRNEILPRKGVYAGWARLESGEIHRAVINIGTNPTFEKAAVLSLEAHLLDFHHDLYGQRIGIHFTQRLRDEKRFSSPDELVQAIHDNIAEARLLLKTPAVSLEPCPAAGLAG